MDIALIGKISSDVERGGPFCGGRLGSGVER
jgi:hypothetical protein